jgi:hypothetical protein
MYGMYPKPVIIRPVQRISFLPRFAIARRDRRNENDAAFYNADKPCHNGLLIHTISTTNRITKWNGGTFDEKGMYPYRIVSFGVERIIRLFIAA